MRAKKNVLKSVSIFSLFLLISYLNLDGQVFSVKIKVGVIMKSGDIKNIARQDFLIVDKDVISDWLKSSASDFGINWSDVRKTVEKNIQEKLEYDNNIKKYKDNNSYLNDQIVELIEKRGDYDVQDLQRQYQLLKKHLESSIDIGKRWKINKEFQIYYDWMGNSFMSYSELMGFEKGLKSKYSNVLEENRSEKFVNEWNIQYKEFEKITEPFLGRVNSIDETIEKTKDEISKNNDDELSFRAKVSSQITEEIDNMKQKIKDEYQTRLIKSIKFSFKTNLLGEASISLPKGKYYIVGIGQINENEVIWDSPISIEKDAQYYELSNDNALSINNASIMETIKKLFKSQSE